MVNIHTDSSLIVAICFSGDGSTFHSIELPAAVKAPTTITRATARNTCNTKLLSGRKQRSQKTSSHANILNTVKNAIACANEISSCENSTSSNKFEGCSVATRVPAITKRKIITRSNSSAVERPSPSQAKLYGKLATARRTRRLRAERRSVLLSRNHKGLLINYTTSGESCQILSATPKIAIQNTDDEFESCEDNDKHRQEQSELSSAQGQDVFLRPNVHSHPSNPKTLLLRERLTSTPSNHGSSLCTLASSRLTGRLEDLSPVVQEAEQCHLALESSRSCIESRLILTDRGVRQRLMKRKVTNRLIQDSGDYKPNSIGPRQLAISQKQIMTSLHENDTGSSASYNTAQSNQYNSHSCQLEDNVTSNTTPNRDCRLAGCGNVDSTPSNIALNSCCIVLSDCQRKALCRGKKPKVASSNIGHETSAIIKSLRSTGNLSVVSDSLLPLDDTRPKSMSLRMPSVDQSKENTCDARKTQSSLDFSVQLQSSFYRDAVRYCVGATPVLTRKQRKAKALGLRSVDVDFSLAFNSKPTRRRRGTPSVNLESNCNLGAKFSVDELNGISLATEKSRDMFTDSPIGTDSCHMEQRTRAPESGSSSSTVASIAPIDGSALLEEYENTSQASALASKRSELSFTPNSSTYHMTKALAAATLNSFDKQNRNFDCKMKVDNVTKSRLSIRRASDEDMNCSFKIPYDVATTPAGEKSVVRGSINIKLEGEDPSQSVREIPTKRGKGWRRSLVSFGPLMSTVSS